MKVLHQPFSKLEFLLLRVLFFYQKNKVQDTLIRAEHTTHGKEAIEASTLSVQQYLLGISMLC